MQQQVSDVSDVISVVANRRQPLGSLIGKPQTPRDLVDMVNGSRSTITRSIRDLEGAGLAERTASGYQATFAGKLACQAYERYCEQLESICTARAIINELPAQSALPRSVLRRASVHQCDPTVPEDPLSKTLASVQEATSVRAIVPTLLTIQLQAYTASIAEGGTELQLVVPENVFSQLIDVHTDQLQELLSASTTGIEEHDSPPLFGVQITECADQREMAVIVYSTSGVKGTIVNTDPAAVQWAESIFDQHRQEARKYHCRGIDREQ